MLKRRHKPTDTSTPALARREVPLTIRAGAGDTIVLRASNDTIADKYGTVITAEALLRDWWVGYQQHRTVSLQHNLPRLREIEGRPMVGVALRVDWAPQLEVDVRILDPKTLELVRAGKITAGSLEFVPTATERRAIAGADAEVYHRLSPEPEHCGLSLVDVPGVPGADILAVRTLPALWAHAVVDPRVLNGEITDPDMVRQLAWLPHHDERSHAIDETQLARALADLEAGRVTIPPFASLTTAQVLERARAHLERHTRLGLGRRAHAEPRKEGHMNEWIRARAAQYEAEGLAKAEAETKAKSDYKALAPDVRAKIEGTPDQGTDGEEQESRGLLARLFGRSNGGDVHVHLGTPATPAQPVQARAAGEGETEQPKAKPDAKPAQAEQPQRRTARDEWLQARAALYQVEDGMDAATAQARAHEDLDADLGLQARLANQPTTPQGDVGAELSPEVRAAMRRPEDPMAAIASGLRIRSQKLDGDQLLSEVLMRTVVPQIGGQRPTTRQLTEAYNMLAEAGIHHRALTIEANGTVVYEELARQFIIKPEPDVVFRNHMRSVPMSGTKKRTFPRFDRAGITHEWNRTSTAAINASDPTLDTFDLEVAELNSKVVVPDSFQMFNAQGASFVGQNLLPAMRGAAQEEEDRVFFLGTGVATDPVEFKGLMAATGVTAVTAGANGDAFTLDILSSLLRAMPVRYRNQVARLAFYMPISRADDFADIVATRATSLGDAFLGAAQGGGMGLGNAVGPTPVGYYRRIPVFGVPQLPDDQTQGTATNIASTIFLVHRDIPVIGDALTIRIEPHRAEDFITKLQLQAWVGLGYQWPEAVVKRVGVLAKA